MKYYEVVRWLDGKVTTIPYETIEEAMKEHEWTKRDFSEGQYDIDAKSSIVKDTEGKIYARWEY